LLSAGVLTLYTFQSLYALGIYGYRSLVAFGPALIVLAVVAARRLVWLRRRGGDAGEGMSGKGSAARQLTE
jgi:hypothetical protein